MSDLLAGTQYQTKRREQIYAQAPYNKSGNGTLYAYMSALLVNARDARLFGRELAELCLAKGGDDNRVHLQSILEQPGVNYDMGRFLTHLQRETAHTRSSRLQYCSVHGENMTHSDVNCRGQQRKARSNQPYQRPRPNRSTQVQGEPPARRDPPPATSGCPADMADRPRNCWACGIPGHSRIKCRRRADIEASPDPAAMRRQIADSWVARGNNLQPRSANTFHVQTAAPAPPPIPPRPPRLGVASVVGAVSATAAPPILHEGMAVDDGTDTGRPLIKAMSDLVISVK
jgi:hypothetical protein